MPQLRMIFPTVTCSTVFLYDSETILCIPGNVHSKFTSKRLYMEARYIRGQGSGATKVYQQGSGKCPGGIQVIKSPFKAKDL